jgi:hypothetical protein
MAAAALAAGAPVGLVLLAVSTIAVRERCGGCRAHRRWGWLRAARLAGVEGE